MPRESRKELKGSLIEHVRIYPAIWNKSHENPEVSEESAWNNIQTALQYRVGDLQKLWTLLWKHYLNILMHKTINHDSTAPKWIFFHNMSFMYEKAKQIIEQKMGGIGPPLLKPAQRSLNASCPCCLHLSNIEDRTNSNDSNATYEQTFDQTRFNEDSETTATQKCSQNQSSHPINTRKKVFYTRFEENRSVLRSKIINAIKSHPVLYEKKKPGTTGGVSWSWRKVAEEVGIPLLTIQNRWRLFRRRYVEELMKERYSKGPFLSHWENFEQMSFMRDNVRADVEKMEHVRQEMQQIIKEQRSRETIDLCADENDTSFVVNEDQTLVPNIDDEILWITSEEDLALESQHHRSQIMQQDQLEFINCDLNMPTTSVITLDLSSSEDEDNQDGNEGNEDVICLDDEAMTMNCIEQIDEENIVYHSEPLNSDIICLDEDDDYERQ